MSFESGNTSLEKVYESQLPPHIIEVCLELGISPEKRNNLKWLPNNIQEPIFLELEKYNTSMGKIWKDESIQYERLFNSKSLQA